MPLVPVMNPADHAAVKGEYEIHLYVQGAKQGVIKGESLAKAHDQEIEISGFAWGVTGHPITSGTPAKPTVSSVSITKSVDRSTTGLITAACTNEMINSVKISWSKSTGANTTDDFMIFTLTNAYVASVQINSGSSQVGKGMGSEVVTFSFQKIDIVYKQQNAMGLVQAAGSVNYTVSGSM